MAGSIVPGTQSALLCDAAKCIVAEMAPQVGSSATAEAGPPTGGSWTR
jgi:hypothetical protein